MRFGSGKGCDNIPCVAANCDTGVVFPDIGPKFFEPRDELISYLSFITSGSVDGNKMTKGVDQPLFVHSVIIH